MITGRLTRIVVAGSLVAAGLLFVTVQAAGASWQQINTPNVPGASEWDFTSVSCTSPRICMAVGETFGGTDHPLSENRTKSGWTIQHVPEHAAGSVLESVWCTFNFACVAVGSAPASSGTVPLAERWNGSSWHIQKTPKPKGTNSSSFDAVTCASALDCVAVGFAFTSTSEVVLVERWNGTSWKIEKTPVRRGFIESELKGVSCTSATSCLAVGDSFRSSPKPEFVTLAELWNGSKWTIQATPNATNGGNLMAIACQSRNACLAVGDGLGARWDGKKWSLVKLASPGDPADLGSISCRGRFCYADGSFFPGGVETGVIEFWDGSRWHVQNADITTSFDSDAYDGISCTTPVNCTAVGFYHDPTLGDRALAQDFTLRWHDASPAPLNGVLATGLSAVSCVSPDSCLAVGSFEDNTGFQTFSEIWDGSSWFVPAQPLKARIGNLDAVSCRAATFCVAVGDVIRAGIPVSLAEVWNGVGWAIQGTPNPSGASRVFLTGVSCPAKNACTAVGWYDRGSAQLTIAEHWNGHSWKIQRTPSPAHQALPQLNSISCVSATACEAVGGTTTGSFAERWDGTSWKIHATPLPKGGKSGFLNSVSCASARACIAVGAFVRSGHEIPLAEFWNGKSWTGRPAATLPGSTASGLLSVSCSSATACGAVGFKVGTATNGFAETWNGKRWGARGIERPPGSQSTGLQSVSCNSAIACMAVGSYEDSMATEQMLAVQYS